ncbi:MAG: hypothetical protein AB2795_20000 [Candidatus Thiodiazotropha endolucinida]
MFSQPFHLFTERKLSDYIHLTLHSVQEKVDQIPKDQFLASSDHDLKEHLYQSLSIEPLTLHIDRSVMEQDETRINVQDYGRAFTVPGTRVDIEIPFTGQRLLWKFQPSTFTVNSPIAEVITDSQGQQVLLLSIQRRQHTDPAEFKDEYQQTLEKIQNYLEWLNRDIAGLNRQLPDYIDRAITARRERLEKHEGLSTMLNIPMKARDGVPPVEPIKVARRIVKPLPAPPDSGYQPEPGISDDIYEDILNMIRHEGRSFETTPHTFVKFDEEELRDIVIAHLNGHFEGGATGETFRKSGKTDIRIEDNERNAFVGECKIWRGSKQAGSALDQLLGYLTWRDCKAALIVFNTNVAGFTELLNKLPATLADHQLMVEDLGQQGDGEWRYQFRSLDDDARIVTVHVFIFNLFIE